MGYGGHFSLPEEPVRTRASLLREPNQVFGPGSHSYSVCNSAAPLGWGPRQFAGSGSGFGGVLTQAWIVNPPPWGMQTVGFGWLEMVRISFF